MALEPPQRDNSFGAALLYAAGLVIIVAALWLLRPIIWPNPQPTGSFAPSQTSSQDFTSTLTPFSTSTFLILPSTPMISYPIATQQVNETEIIDSQGVSMELVPAGSFSMGYGNTDIADQDTGETTVHTVNISAFYMDKYEVINAFYKACVDSGNCQPPVNTSAYDNQSFADYPVVYVNWDMANAYCSWRNARLPTEAEWEKAARGTDGRIYPWGNNSPDSTRANFNNQGGAIRVGNYENGKSPYGIYDMAGNVWEWVSDWFQTNYYATLSNNVSDPQGPDSPDNDTGRVIRGGAWFNTGKSIRSTLRNYIDPSLAHPFVGFRCARSAAP
jgi:formylglycine-generating enzyme required for sulfatase activity